MDLEYSKEQKQMNASVKIMLSYDYNHFEVALSSDDIMDMKQINELRKCVQRLADEAVRQYKIAYQKTKLRLQLESEKKYLMEEIKQIKEMPESEWRAEDKAKVKALEDFDYWNQHNYDYEDDENIPF